MNLKIKIRGEKNLTTVEVKNKEINDWKKKWSSHYIPYLYLSRNKSRTITNAKEWHQMEESYLDREYK